MRIISRSEKFKKAITAMLQEFCDRSFTIIDLDTLPEIFDVEEQEKVILVGRYPLADYKRYGILDKLANKSGFVLVHRSKQKMATLMREAIDQ